MTTLHVSAGGPGSRIRPYILSTKREAPKHLLALPTPSGTILDQIVDQGMGLFDQIKIWTGPTNHEALKQYFGEEMVLLDRHMTGPLGPVVREIQATSERTFGCAGDFFCRFSWAEFVQFHNAHGLPATILVARSVAAPKGARFLLDGHRVTGWERVERTREEDRINIGCYILDPDPRLMECLAGLQSHKEDPFFDSLIRAGLLAGYDPGVRGFNINVAEVYEALLATF